MSFSLLAREIERTSELAKSLAAASNTMSFEGSDGVVSQLELPRFGRYYLGDLGKGYVLDSPREEMHAIWYEGPAGVVFPKHRHPYAESMFVASGRMVDLITDRGAGPGEVMHLLPNEWHEIKFVEACVFLLVWTPEPLRDENDDR